MNTPPKQFNYLKGYSFVFEDGSNVIESWFSCFSGLEKVKVNDKLVAKQRNLSTNSGNQFELDGSIYRTNIEVRNIFKGPFICSLFKNESLLRQQRLIFPAHGKNAPWYGKLWFYILVGFFLGLSSVYFNYSLWIALAAITAPSIFTYLKGSNQKPFIEEIDVEDI